MHAGTDRSGGRRGSVAERAVVIGSIAGAIVGGVGGLLIGISAYPPTAPFAAVEGAILGSVTGTALAGLFCGVAALRRWWARR